MRMAVGDTRSALKEGSAIAVRVYDVGSDIQAPRAGAAGLAEKGRALAAPVGWDRGKPGGFNRLCRGSRAGSRAP